MWYAEYLFGDLKLGFIVTVTYLVDQPEYISKREMAVTFNKIHQKLGSKFRNIHTIYLSPFFKVALKTHSDL